jgi:transcriptional regulator
MYVPTAYAETDERTLHDFIRQNNFGLLVAHGEGGLSASHLPILLDPYSGPRGHLLGHMARANRQWRQVEGEVLVVFSGPHAYISPTWYEARDVVPTWNYVAVHAYGTLRLVEDREELMNLLGRMVDFYEGSRAKPWPLDQESEYIAQMVKAIVGFRIEISRLEGKWKLGQNHPPERRARVVRALEAQNEEDSRAIASLMAATIKDKAPQSERCSTYLVRRGSYDPAEKPDRRSPRDLSGSCDASLKPVQPSLPPEAQSG